MTRLINTLNNWPSPNIKQYLKPELLNLDTGILPLHLATTQGGQVNSDKLDLTILSTSEDRDNILVKTGIFFTEIIGGCNCDDDPIEANAYAIIEIKINKESAQALFTIIQE